MKMTSIFLFTLLIFGCSIKQRLLGKYVSPGNPNVFEFKSDSIFLNEYREGHAIKHSVGKWQLSHGDTIILNTAIKSTLIPLKMNGIDSADASGVILRIDLAIQGGLSLDNYHCYIWKNRDDPIIKRCDSLSSILLPGPIYSLSFTISKDPIKEEENVFSLETQKLEFRKTLKNNLDIQMKFEDSLFYYHPFDNVKVIVAKKNYIQLFNSYQNKWQVFKKVPNSEKIFVKLNE